jgi:hypothetical protein
LDESSIDNGKIGFQPGVAKASSSDADGVFSKICVETSPDLGDQIQRIAEYRDAFKPT